MVHRAVRYRIHQPCKEPPACLPVDIQAWPSKIAPKCDVMLR